MAESVTIVGMAGGFIALAIFLGIGTIILGGSITDCTQVNDYNATADDFGATTDHNQVGWAAQCFSNNSQAQSGYGLLMVSLIVLAAAVVLIVVRLLSA